MSATQTKTMDLGAPRRAWLAGALGLALLSSGAAALIFEIVWFHLTGLVFGNSIWATSLVLAAFMGGLGCGNLLASKLGDRVPRPVIAYAGAELVVATTGILLTLALPHLPELLAPLFRALGNPWLSNCTRLVFAFLLLVIPTTAMGFTLPLVVRVLSRDGTTFGPTLGICYGLNTLGAVAGVILAETWLIQRFGIRGAASMAALFNLAACGIAISIRGFDPCSPISLGSQLSERFSVRARCLLLATFLFGAALLALEVLWFRFTLMFVVNNSLALACMLAVVLIGIAGGGFAGAALARPEIVKWGLWYLAWAAAAAMVVTYRAFDASLSASSPYAWTTVLRLSLALMLPGTVLSGALFTFVGQALSAELWGHARSAGLLTLCNTAGAVLGALCGGFLLLPLLGVEHSFFAIALVYAAAAALTSTRSHWVPLRRTTAVPIAVAITGSVLLSTFPFGRMQTVFVPQVAGKFSGDGSHVIAARESPTESILYMRVDWLGQPLHYRLVTNGFTMSGTGYAAKRYMRLYAFWPAIVSGQTIRDVLIISYGVGATASAVRDLPDVTHIDVVDTSRDIVQMSDLVYVKHQHPLLDPRVDVHIEDGRHFLLTTEHSYNLITGEPPPPRLPGITNLYSHEYFRLIYNRLTDGGVTTYWLPVHDLLREDVQAIVAAFCDVFENCTLWQGTPLDWMLVGFRGEPTATTVENFTRWWKDPVIGPQLAEIGLDVPEQLGTTFLGDAEYWRSFVAGAPPLTDNYPKRLQPLYGPPDPRMRFVAEVVNVPRARAAFATSLEIQKLWPEELRHDTDSFFDLQQLTNVALTQQPDPVARIDQLHTLLTTGMTPTLALWWLGPTTRHVRIAEGAPPSGLRDYTLALASLANGRYDQALALFEHAFEEGVTAWTARYLYVYTLCLTGRANEARELAAPLRMAATSGSQKQFWVWLDAHFELQGLE